MLQALYACGRFREQVLAHHARATDEDTLLAALGDLFAQVANAKKRTGVVAPKRFIARLKKDNELFRSYMHQDAHEFLNYLLNSCCDILEKEAREGCAREQKPALALALAQGRTCTMPHTQGAHPGRKSACAARARLSPCATALYLTSPRSLTGARQVAASSAWRAPPARAHLGA